DLDFRENYAYSVLEHIRSIESLILKVYGDVNRSNTTIADEWLMSRLQRHVKEVTNDLNNVRLRSAAVRIFYLMYQDLVDYLNLSENSPSNVAAEFIESWIKMMVPYTPHIAEEIWHRLGKDTLAINEDWPSHREDRINTDAELSVEFVKTLINDVREIAKFVKEGRTLYLYVSRKESYGDLIKIVDYVANGKPLNEIVRSFTKGLSTKELNEAVKKVRRLYDLVISLRPEIKDLIIKSGGIDEGYVINSLANYMKSSLGVKEVVVYYADDADAPNFGG
ncbi:MAG: class I tRNA ligase family protein, partial [Sulfolobales archaeon]